MPCFSHWAATGLVVSGVDVVRIRSTLFWSASSWATWPARVGLDWLSVTVILILYFLPPTLKPFL